MIEKLSYKDREMVIDVESDLEKHRFSTWLSKEPETITWIETIFKKDDIFYDIGANIGMYSIFAKSIFGDDLTVYAFEPVYHNFYKLCKNIILNKFYSGMHVYPLALNSTTKLDSISLSSSVSGSAMHVMDGSIEHKTDFVPVFIQGSTSFSLDDLILKFGLPVPNHIKIDTDGLEYAIIKGGLEVIKNKNVKSILIEISAKETEGLHVIKIMKEAGFVMTHPINSQSNHSRERRKKNNNYFENIIFTRLD